MARRFLTYLRAMLPETDIPQRGLVAASRRPISARIRLEFL
jgi:hypothetical protein